MREHHVGSLVVVDAATGDGRPGNIVTDRDLVLAVMAEGLDPALFTVGDIMSTQLVTAPADTALIDATRLLHQHRVRRLIVTDEAGRVVGLAASRTSRGADARVQRTRVRAARARDREMKERR